MTVLERPIADTDDVPAPIPRSRSLADRAFQVLLTSSSALVLFILLATVLFLAVKGYPAFKLGGFSIFTDSTWAPDAHHFGVLSLLIGSFAIALVAIVIAVPVSIATALMINEYSPRKLRPWLISTVDLLATIPSIVYGFWGLEFVSGIQAAPAKWIVDHFNFVPIFRTPTPNSYVLSVFACGLICSLTIIPIVTSVTREVMSLAPRDVAEAALGLGGTRWGMITDVLFPFSRNGILGATLLGFGRGLGETMIVVLVLSQGNHITGAIMGPNGLGSVAKEITENFESGDSLEKSALVLAGLALFASTLLVNSLARVIVERSEAKAR